MAAPMSRDSGLPKLATFALESSIDLYNKVETFRDHSTHVYRLKTELNGLKDILGSLTEIVSATSQDLSTLDLPLQRCGNACGEFQQSLECLSLSGGSQAGIPGRDKLTYMGDNIDEFSQQLSIYKSIINIALTNANLQVSELLCILEQL